MLELEEHVEIRCSFVGMCHTTSTLSHMSSKNIIIYVIFWEVKKDTYNRNIQYMTCVLVFLNEIKLEYFDLMYVH